MDLKWLLILSALCIGAYGYQAFQGRIPNGDKVQHPCDSSQTWGGVGHFMSGGGGNRNQFGLDFNENGQKWTRCLCEHDSDGDGVSNGQELGDPNCVWEEGDTPEVTTGITHPGLCEPKADPSCLRRNADFGDICDTPVFDCPAVNNPGVLTHELRFAETLVPDTETNYYCMSATLPSDGDYHLVGYEPIINNTNMVHHIIIYGCADDVDPDMLSAYETPRACDMGLQGCTNLIGIWGYGHPGSCFPDHYGFKIGNDGFSKIVMEIHYNNPLALPEQYDSSGFHLYYTDDKRVNDAAVFATGVDDVFSLPPGYSNYTHYGGCGPTCTADWNKTLTLENVIFHMHYLGISAKLEMLRNGTVMKEIEIKKYNYDSPVTIPLDEPFEFHPGDSLRLSCSFDTTSKDDYTYWGDGTSDEMCFVFITYYPAMELNNPFCTGFRDIDLCDLYRTGSHGDCDGVYQFFQGAELEAFAVKLYGACDLTGEECKPECKELMEEAKSHPCMEGDLFHYFDQLVLSAQTEEMHTFSRIINSCETDPHEKKGGEKKDISGEFNKDCYVIGDSDGGTTGSADSVNSFRVLTLTGVMFWIFCQF